MNTLLIIDTCIMALSAILIIPQLFLMRKQLKNNHEEHRRENTVNILHIWCNSLKKESSMSEDVVRKFNEQQCQSLYKHEPFGVSDEVIPSICKFCTLSKDDCPNCKITTSKRVEGKILNELRYHVISYLNMLETVMVSWHLGIVDQETIEDEFRFLAADGKGMALDAFRRTAGGYPLIGSFIDKIKDKTAPPKKPL